MLHNKITIIIFTIIILLMFPVYVYATNQDTNESIKNKVGLLTVYTNNEKMDKISLTIQNILSHYLGKIDKKIEIKLITDKYKNELRFKKDGADGQLINQVIEIGKDETLDTILIIGTSSTLSSIISTITIIKPNRETDIIPYKNVFQIDVKELEEGYPPEEIIREINNIVNAVISVKITITTNPKISLIYINDQFISYAEPSVEIIASIGKYDLKIISEGYETLTQELLIRKDEHFNFELNYRFFNKRGLSIMGMFDVFEGMFPENDEQMKLSTSYSFQYFFDLFNHSKFYLEFNLILLNVTRINIAKFMNKEFETSIEINSLLFYGNLRYEPVFEKFRWLNPIIGVGIWIASHSTKPRVTTASNFSLNIIAGFSINFHRRWSFVAEYRYLLLGDLTLIELVEMLPGTGIRLNTIEDNYDGSIILVGMRYNL